MLDFRSAREEVSALGDEAHYEGKSRHVGLNTAALAIIEDFPTVKERSALALAFTDAYDAARDRNFQFDLLGVPLELRA